MADQLANHLRRKIASYENAGLTDQVTALKAKLAKVEKAEAKAAKQEAKAEPVEVAEAEPDADEDEPTDVSEYHVGGGWYEVGDEKVRGEDAARELLEGKG